MDVVTQIVSVRRRDTAGLPRMLGASVLGHLGLIAVVALAPASWFGATLHKEPENVMTISLGGAPGPRDGGLTMLGGRPIQQVVEAAKTVEPVRPPAAREPEMIEPSKVTPKKPEPKKPEPKVNETIKDARSRAPTKGPEKREGSTVAETGGAGKAFGLSQGGGGTGAYLDTADFCCPEYLSRMLDLINRNWDSKQGTVVTTVMKFVIQRDGRLLDIKVDKSSGYPALDGLAHRALVLTRQLPPLPAAYTEPALTVRFQFEYTR